MTDSIDYDSLYNYDIQEVQLFTDNAIDKAIDYDRDK